MCTTIDIIKKIIVIIILPGHNFPGHRITASFSSFFGTLKIHVQRHLQHLVRTKWVVTAKRPTARNAKYVKPALVHAKACGGKEGGLLGTGSVAFPLDFHE